MIILGLLCLLLDYRVMANPTGCTYDAASVLYTCDSRGWSLPMTFSQFTVQPQRILIKNMNGELTNLAPNGPVFSGFNSMNTALFDKRFSPSLRIMCIVGGSLMLVKDAFTDFGWLEEFIIQDCQILSVAASVFSHFGELNSFIIQGGSIDNMVPDSFSGIDVKRIATAPIPKGEFILRNTRLVDGSLQFGALFGQGNVTNIVLDGLNMTSSFLSDTISRNFLLRKFSLSSNGITSIPENLFSATNSLESVRLSGFVWDCTCNSLWFIPYADAYNISLEGDLICSTPSAYQNSMLSLYYYAKCLSNDPCKNNIGIASGDTCYTILDIATYVFFLINVIITPIAFGLVLHLTLRIKDIKQKRRGVTLRRMFGLALNVTRIKNYKEPVKTRDPSFE